MFLQHQSLKWNWLKKRSKFLKKKYPESSICDICLGNTQYIDQQITQCKVCLFKTHPNCYGTKELREASINNECNRNWTCQRCAILVKLDLMTIFRKSAFCIMCPDVKGLIKVVKSFDKPYYAHPSCILFSKIKFLDAEFVFSLIRHDYVRKIELLKSNFNNVCIYCNIPYGIPYKVRVI